MATVDTKVKLSSYLLDSSKHPEYFPQWQSDILSVVSSSDAGQELKSFLFHSWGRVHSRTHSVPQWQYDPKWDFDGNSESAASPGVPPASEDTVGEASLWGLTYISRYAVAL